MATKKEKVLSAASLTIRRPAEMTAKGRRDIAAWLRRMADELVELGSEYSTEFRARYWFKAP